MKKSLLVLLFVTSVFASINWQNNFYKAFETAQKQNRPIFLFIERKNPPCKWCEKMKKTTLKDEKISSFINKNFIPVKVAREEGGYPQELFPRYVPTIYIITPDKRVIKQIIGYWPKEDFLSDLEDIKRILKK